MSDIRQGKDGELTLQFTQPVFDARFDVFEMERVFVVDPLRCADGDAGLSYTLNPFDDKCAVPIVKRLIAADE